MDPLVPTSHHKLLYPPSLLLLAPRLPEPADETLLLSHDPPLLITVLYVPMAPILLEASSYLEGFLAEEPSFFPVSQRTADPWAHPPFLGLYSMDLLGWCPDPWGLQYH